MPSISQSETTSSSALSAGPNAAAGDLAASLSAQGAEAVALVGSRATGEAGPDSDLDLAVVGEGPHYRLEVDGSLLVSLGWATAEEQRQRLYDPAWLGTHVPGWRTAVLIWDPAGVAASIQQEALSWTWDKVGEACDRWVAEQITGFGEEAQRLTASLRTGAELTAAVQRSVLALRLAPVIAIHRRLLYGSEKRLWQLVADELGPGWESTQRAALGIAGEPWQEGGRAALDLFRLAAAEVRPLLDDRQRAVIDTVAAERTLRSSRGAGRSGTASPGSQSPDRP